MNKQHCSTAILAAALVLGACSTGHELAGVSRSRLVVDSRYDTRPDARAEAFTAPYRRQVDSLMSPVVGRAAETLAAGRPESKLSNLLTDILVWSAGRFGEHPDFAVYNIGGMRAAFAPGPVTYGDVLDVAPFENKICFVTLTGDKVLELFGQIAARGGEGVSHAVRLAITPGGRLVSAEVGGQPVDSGRLYRIATIDYVAEGNDQMVAFKASTDVVSPRGDENNVRNIIMDYFGDQARRGRAVSARLEGRIVVR